LRPNRDKFGTGSVIASFSVFEVLSGWFRVTGTDVVDAML